MVVAAVVCGSLGVASPALAVAPGACGSVLLSGSSWLNGGGVDVYSNGADEGTGASCGGGDHYQCVELVNRLYQAKGWISGMWSGNGGRSSPGARDSLWDEAPSNLSKQANGSISYVGPGDEVSINLYDGSEFIEDGHALIVNNTTSITSGTVYLVSQNSGSPSGANVQITATLSNGTLTIPNSGAWSYPVIGAVHAPGGGGSPPPPPPPPPLPDATRGMVLDNASQQMFAFTDGPSDSLDALWDTAGQPWNGPQEVGRTESTYSAPAAVLDQNSNQMFVFAEGADHKLDVYWDTVAQPWNGPEVIGAAGSTYSAPDVVLDQRSNQMFVLVEGPRHELDVYWDTAGQPWNGPEVIGQAGSTYSAPALVLDENSSQLFALTEGANNSLEARWDTLGQPWVDPEIIGPAGSTYSAPAAALDENSSQLFVFTEGPANSLETRWVALGQAWNGPETIGAPGSTYSTPSVLLQESASLLLLFAVGPGGSLDEYWATLGQPWVGPHTLGQEGTTFSMPSAVLNAKTGFTDVIAQGASNTLTDYWVIPGGAWGGPGYVAGGGSTYMIPLESIEPLAPSSTNPPTSPTSTTQTETVGNSSPTPEPSNGVPLVPTRAASGVLAAKETSGPRPSALSRALVKCRKIKNRHRRAKCEASAKHLYHTTKKKKR